MMFGARLVGNHRGDPADQRHIERRRQPDGLRKHRGTAGPANPVQTFIPPVIGRHIEPGDRRGPVEHLRDLLAQGHLRHQDVRPLPGRKFGIAVTTVDPATLQGRPPVVFVRSRGSSCRHLGFSPGVELGADFMTALAGERIDEDRDEADEEADAAG